MFRLECMLGDTHGWVQVESLLGRQVGEQDLQYGCLPAPVGWVVLAVVRLAQVREGTF